MQAAQWPEAKGRHLALDVLRQQQVPKFHYLGAYGIACTHQNHLGPSMICGDTVCSLEQGKEALGAWQDRYAAAISPLDTES